MDGRKIFLAPVAGYLVMQYRCRTCSTPLFTDDDILDIHILTEKQKRSWTSSKRLGAGQPPINRCTSINIKEGSWFGVDFDSGAQEGAIYCPNARCNSKIGRYCWHGLPCSCGAWTTPSFQIHKSKLDIMDFEHIDKFLSITSQVVHETTVV